MVPEPSAGTPKLSRQGTNTSIGSQSDAASTPWDDSGDAEQQGGAHERRSPPGPHAVRVWGAEPSQPPRGTRPVFVPPLNITAAQDVAASLLDASSGSGEGSEEGEEEEEMEEEEEEEEGSGAEDAAATGGGVGAVRQLTSLKLPCDAAEPARPEFRVDWPEAAAAAPAAAPARPARGWGACRALALALFAAYAAVAAWEVPPLPPVLSGHVSSFPLY